MCTFSPPARLYVNIIVKFLSDMEEILNDREVLHKLLDKILDSNGKRMRLCSAYFLRHFPVNVQPKQHIVCE